MHEQILVIVERIEVDPLVVAARRARLKEFLLGKSAYRVVLSSTHSVMVVRP